MHPVPYPRIPPAAIVVEPLQGWVDTDYHKIQAVPEMSVSRIIIAGSDFFSAGILQKFNDSNIKTNMMEVKQGLNEFLVKFFVFFEIIYLVASLICLVMNGVAYKRHFLPVGRP